MYRISLLAIPEIACSFHALITMPPCLRAPLPVCPLPVDSVAECRSAGEAAKRCLRIPCKGYSNVGFIVVCLLLLFTSMTSITPPNEHVDAGSPAPLAIPSVPQLPRLVEPLTTLPVWSGYGVAPPHQVFFPYKMVQLNYLHGEAAQASHQRDRNAEPDSLYLRHISSDDWDHGISQLCLVYPDQGPRMIKRGYPNMLLQSVHRERSILALLLQWLLRIRPDITHGENTRY